MLRDMDFVGCDDSTTEFGSTKSNKADQKIYLAKEFQHSLAPILSWNQWIILPNLLDLLLIFIEKKRWTISLWQEAIKRSWWTSDTWSSTQIGSQLKASRTTCHKMPQVFDHVSGSFFTGEETWTNHQNGQRSPIFYREKKPGPFPGWLDFLSPKTWWLKIGLFFWVWRTQNHRNFRLYAFNFFLNRPWWVMKKKRPRYT